MNFWDRIKEFFRVEEKKTPEFPYRRVHSIPAHTSRRESSHSSGGDFMFGGESDGGCGGGDGGGGE